MAKSRKTPTLAFHGDELPWVSESLGILFGWVMARIVTGGSVTSHPHEGLGHQPPADRILTLLPRFPQQARIGIRTPVFRRRSVVHQVDVGTNSDPSPIGNPAT